MTNIKKVAVLGAGNLGAQIAFRVAFHGIDTVSYDINEEALEGARGRFAAIAQNYVRDLDEVTEEQTKAAISHITQSTDLAAAVKDVDLVIEAVPEVLKIKQDTYAKLADSLKPEAIVVSNSSTLLPSDMAPFTGRPEKFMSYHFANNIHRRNIVELMPHPGTADETYETILEFAPEMGMVPIQLRKEQPGYIINSLLVPWLHAAASLWVNGIADIETIDKTAAAITLSKNAQFAPFRVYDTVGFGVAYAIASNSEDPDQQAFTRRLKEDFIDKGFLGVETRHGFYLYDEDGKPTGLSDEAKRIYDEK